MNNTLPSAAHTHKQFTFWMDSHVIKQTRAVQTAGSGHPSKTSCTVSLAPARSPRDTRVTDGATEELWVRGGGEHKSVTGWKMSRWKVKLGDGDTESKKNRKQKWRWCERESERRKGVINNLIILDAEITFDPTGLQVRKKQTEALGKHMVSVYPLHMSAGHTCR